MIILFTICILIDLFSYRFSSSLSHSQKFPRLESKNVQFWFKNRRAKCKRLKMSLYDPAQLANLGEQAHLAALHDAPHLSGLHEASQMHPFHHGDRD